jgi:hypothetical protein
MWARVKKFILKHAFFIIPALFGVWSLFLGQDRNQDLTNYHIYNAFSYLNNKFDVDFAAAGVQTFFNPILDVFFYTLNTNLPVKLFGFLMGVLHGLIFIAIFFISKILLNHQSKNYSNEYIFLIAFIACLTPNFLAGLGNSMGDNSTAIFEIFAFMMILNRIDKIKFNTVINQLYFCIPGLLAGIGVGLKLTNAPFALAMCASFLFLRKKFIFKSYLAFLFGISVVSGILISGGFWHLKLWSLYGNPFFPQFSNIFVNTWSSLAFESHSWVPQSLQEIFLWPFITSLDYHRLGEGLVHQFLWPLFYGLLILKLIFYFFKSNKFSQFKKSDLNLYFFSFIILGYIFWMLVFSIQRYIVTIELLVPLAIAILINEGSNYKKTLYILIASALFILFGGFGTWGHTKWIEPPFSAEIPNLSSSDINSSTVFLTRHGMPLSWIASFFPSNLSFIHISALELYNTNKVNQIIQRRKGNFYVIFAGAYNWRTDNVKKWNDIFSSLHLMKNKETCNRLDLIINKVSFRGKIKFEDKMVNGDQCYITLRDKDYIDLDLANQSIIHKNKDELLRFGYTINEKSCRVYPARIGAQNWRYIWCSVTNNNHY